MVLPTSQVFLDPMDGFDTRAFDPTRQRAIDDYTRQDFENASPVSAPLARFFVQQVRRYAGASDQVQRTLRVLRGRFMSGERVAVLERERAAHASALPASPDAAEDRAALQAFADELAER